MISDKTKPTTLHQQLLILSKQAGAVHAALESAQVNLPKETSDDINNLETLLGQLSKKMEVFENED